MPRELLVCASFVVCLNTVSTAQSLPGTIAGHVVDETGGAMPGVTVELRSESDGAEPLVEVTNGTGDYAFVNVAPDRYQVAFTLVNFASVTRRGVEVGQARVQLDVTMQLSLNAEVVVVGKRTFANLADVENPAENLVGIAQSASQGAITAKQLDVRPFMRQGEVLETVPGVIVTQHSGEGKANQYFLRGFNLDHGSDFAMTVAGDAGQHADACAQPGLLGHQLPDSGTRRGRAVLEGSVLRRSGRLRNRRRRRTSTTRRRSIGRSSTSEGGTYGYGRGSSPPRRAWARGICSRRSRRPPTRARGRFPDSYKKYNGVLRYSQGDNVNGFSLTFMGYHGKWNATEATPATRGRRRPDRPLRVASTRPTAATPTATASAANGSTARARR